MPGESSAASAPRVPLSSGEELTEEFEAVLRAIFKRFDVDKDELLSVAELHEFSRACNAGKPFPADQIQEMRDYLDWDERADALKQYGFLQMYHLQTISEPDETWKDLYALNYDNSLKLRHTGDAAAKDGSISTAKAEGTAKKNEVFRKLLTLNSAIDDLEIRVTAMEMAYGMR